MYPALTFVHMTKAWFGFVSGEFDYFFFIIPQFVYKKINKLDILGMLCIYFCINPKQWKTMLKIGKFPKSLRKVWIDFFVWYFKTCLVTVHPGLSVVNHHCRPRLFLMGHKQPPPPDRNWPSVSTFPHWPAAYHRCHLRLSPMSHFHFTNLYHPSQSFPFVRRSTTVAALGYPSWVKYTPGM